MAYGPNQVLSIWLLTTHHWAYTRRRSKCESPVASQPAGVTILSAAEQYFTIA